MPKALTLYGQTFHSRLLLGTAQYPSPQVLLDAIESAQCDIITLGLRRQSPELKGGENFWQTLKQSNKTLLPNTAGCKTVKEAVNTAEMSRELFETDWVKLEVIGDDYNLQPDPFGLVEAARQLIQSGFKVFPYCTDDLVLCQKLLEVGCEVLMPWGSPIGTGQGLMNRYNLQTIRERLPDIPLIVDAGIGAPSQACEAMEMGYDAVLLNTAVAKALDPVIMAAAFAQSIDAGHRAFQAGLMTKRQTAEPSTPTIGQPFWHRSK